MQTFSRKLFVPKNLLILSAILLSLIFPLLIQQEYFIHVMILVFYYALLSEAWNLIGGYGGQISIGHSAFLGIGAYTSTLLFLKFGLNPWLGMLLAGLFATIFGVGIGFVSFRLRGAFFLLISLAFAMIVQVVLLNISTITGGSTGMLISSSGNSILGFYFISRVPYYYIIFIMMLVTVFVVYKVANSKLGFSLLAIREDEDAAESLGVNAFRCKMKALALSAFLVGITGTFYAQYMRFIDPYQVDSLTLSNMLIVNTIVGGAATILGPILGVLILTPLSELLWFLFGSYSGLYLIIYGIALIAVICTQPSGIIKALEKFQKTISK